MDTARIREARKVVLTSRQLEIVIGSLLGDAYLMATTRGFAFRVNHGLGQKEYVDWKYQELSNLVNSPPRSSGQCYYFRTISHVTFANLHGKFYVKNVKSLPEDLESYMTPLTLAVWLMDDGSRDGNQVRINTQSFSRAENELLIDVLKAKLGISATINRDKNRFRLRVKASSMELMNQLLVPHIIPSMQYKLSL